MMNEGREYRIYGNEEYNPIVQIWTAQWTDKACPKCGSLMAWMLSRDTCPMCGTGKPDTTPVKMPMTKELSQKTEKAIRCQQRQLKPKKPKVYALPVQIKILSACTCYICGGIIKPQELHFADAYIKKDRKKWHIAC